MPRRYDDDDSIDEPADGIRPWHFLILGMGLAGFLMVGLLVAGVVFWRAAATAKAKATAERDTLATQVASAASEHTERQARGEVIDSGVPLLLDAYEENELAADRQFKGKTVRLIFCDINHVRAEGGVIVVTLADPNADRGKSVRCEFPGSMAPVFAGMGGFRRVANIVGECAGLRGGVPVLTDCRLEAIPLGGD